VAGARRDRLTRPAAVVLTGIVVLVAAVRLLPLSLRGLDDEADEEMRARVTAAHAGDDAAPEAWIAEHPVPFARKVAATRARLAAQLTYRGEDGREHVYLGDYDSYLWLRRARQYLRSGTTCDAVAGGECLDRHVNAPVGGHMQYAHSIHIAAVAAVHRLATLVHPGWPLPSSSFLVPVIVGGLLAIPAFALGRHLAGDPGGACAAVLVALNVTLLQRSIGSDDDVWHVALPLTMVWAIDAALATRRASACAAWAALAAALGALHAMSWRGWVFTWAVVVGGLGAHVVVCAARGWARRPGAAASVRHAALVLLVFYAVGAGLALSRGAAGTYLRLPMEALAPPAASLPGRWPDVLATVAELSRLGRDDIETAMGGRLYFFVGWLGLLVLALPRGRWQPSHFAVLMGGTLLYRWLLTGPEVSRPVLVAALAVPLAAAVLLSVAEPEERARGGTRLVVMVWYLAALFLARGAARFMLLLVAPFGLAFGVAVGSLVERLRGLVTDAAWRDMAASLAAWAIVVLVLVLPVRRGVATASAYLPRMHDAWWETLTRLRATTPPDAIVDAWWDYGYWVEYVADRGSASDGGSLLTHVPHWLARALLASDEEEAAGLLRMLACGSDAAPQPEGARGAWGKLVSYGIAPDTAHDVVIEIASLDRENARARLLAHGLDDAAAADVLRSTHCTPPETYLVLSSAQSSIWPSVGRYGGTPELPPEAVAPTRRVACRATRGDTRVCATTLAVPEGIVRGFVYAAGEPAAGRLVLAPAHGGAPRRVSPALVLLARNGELHAIEPAGAGTDTLGVLLDVETGRAVFGAPALLRSTFARLMFLDGRYARRFEKADDRTGFRDERVVTWALRWERPGVPVEGQSRRERRASSIS